MFIGIIHYNLLIFISFFFGVTIFIGYHFIMNIDVLVNITNSANHKLLKMNVFQGCLAFSQRRLYAKFSCIGRRNAGNTANILYNRGLQGPFGKHNNFCSVHFIYLLIL